MYVVTFVGFVILGRLNERLVREVAKLHSYRFLCEEQHVAHGVKCAMCDKSAKNPNLNLRPITSAQVEEDMNGTGPDYELPLCRTCTGRAIEADMWTEVERRRTARESREQAK